MTSDVDKHRGPTRRSSVVYVTVVSIAVLIILALAAMLLWFTVWPTTGTTSIVRPDMTIESQMFVSGGFYITRSIQHPAATSANYEFPPKGEQELETVLPWLDDLRKTALKGIPKSELNATQNVPRKMQKNLTKHNSKE